jgi:hypothetical protein
MDTVDKRKEARNNIHKKHYLFETVYSINRIDVLACFRFVSLNLDTKSLKHQIPITDTKALKRS